MLAETPTLRLNTLQRFCSLSQMSYGVAKIKNRSLVNLLLKTMPMEMTMMGMTMTTPVALMMLKMAMASTKIRQRSKDQLAAWPKLRSLDPKEHTSVRTSIANMNTLSAIQSPAGHVVIPYQLTQWQRHTHIALASAHLNDIYQDLELDINYDQFTMLTLALSGVDQFRGYTFSKSEEEFREQIYEWCNPDRLTCNDPQNPANPNLMQATCEIAEEFRAQVNDMMRDITPQWALQTLQKNMRDDVDWNEVADLFVMNVKSDGSSKHHGLNKTQYMLITTRLDAMRESIARGDIHTFLSQIAAADGSD